jgi:hypothetical protein
MHSMNDEHETDSAGEPEPDVDIIQRELEECDIDAERALEVLMATIVARHIDIELRKRGGRPPWGPGRERANALVPAMDALHELSCVPGQESFDYSPVPDLPPGDAVNVRRMLFRLFGQLQFAAEKRHGMYGDDEPRPWMRLVRD